jgi:hypothetical protein
LASYSDGCSRVRGEHLSRSAEEAAGPDDQPRWRGGKRLCAPPALERVPAAVLEDDAPGGNHQLRPQNAHLWSVANPEPVTGVAGCSDSKRSLVPYAGQFGAPAELGSPVRANCVQ